MPRREDLVKRFQLTVVLEAWFGLYDQDPYLSNGTTTVAVGAEYQVQTNKDDYDNDNGRKSDLMLMEDIPLPMDPRKFSHIGGESVQRSLKTEFEVMDQDPYSSDVLAAAVEASSLSPDAEEGELRLSGGWGWAGRKWDREFENFKELKIELLMKLYMRYSTSVRVSTRLSGR
ncbi:predicted protein [Histoplasma mississippiense (nom. inval.)]|uniref:predicted protein n=1 Tax=Ajellomyces capsulatus (strain NAm1 / WU24) TaxID=2059318 RepID=UPI000157C82B|nr:predicted protein [Histoplasma mississippiense (nom. inval.)]EDN09826.1 predicted protein [Histoplasma mississippiense (nom. inval.)]